jgi:environmental stress-induced protein Ves
MTPVAYASLAAVPWKNGGGVTRELACHPAGAGFDDFLWRVSIADVHQSGPFSRFPGVDRVILLLDGGGMILRSGEGEHGLTTPLLPHAFRGEQEIDAQLVSPSRDFNLMLRRDRAAGSVTVLHASDAVGTTGTTTLLFCASGAWQIGACILNVGDHVQIEPGRAADVIMHQAGALLRVDITPT